MMTVFAAGLGACGTTANDDSPIIAISAELYDTFPGATANPNLNPVCGKKVLITYAGKSVQAIVQDRCAGCAGVWDVDLSTSLFQQLAPFSVGRMQVSVRTILVNCGVETDDGSFTVDLPLEEEMYRTRWTL